MVACLGFSAALDMAEDASERTASEVCFAFSTAREAVILKGAEDVEEGKAIEDMVISDCCPWPGHCGQSDWERKQKSKQKLTEDTKKKWHVRSLYSGANSFEWYKLQLSERERKDGQPYMRWMVCNGRGRGS